MQSVNVQNHHIKNHTYANLENPVTRQFVLTGSHQLALREAITQSLAGISFSTAEDYIYHGFLPRIYAQQHRPTQAYSNYYQAGWAS